MEAPRDTEKKNAQAAIDNCITQVCAGFAKEGAA